MKGEKIALVFMACVMGTLSVDLNVQTLYGNATGFISPYGSHKVWFLPYAAPPTGNNRWKSPQPLSAWSGTYNASVTPPMCPQTGVLAQYYSSSEDCLYLSVFVPLNHNPADSLLPVQVFIHGGYFTQGSAIFYSGEILSGTDLIYVAINYRLGLLGNLAHPVLQRDPERSGGAGFYGLQDQRASLQWVQDNIEYFGGDKNKVTISGESAGAISVCAHLAASKSAGLFHQAIIESGFCTLWTNDSAVSRATDVVTQLGCTSAVDSEVMSCLLGLNASTLAGAVSVSSSFPSLSSELTSQPRDILLGGGGLRVPLLIGANKNESTFFVCQSPSTNNLTADQYAALVNTAFPSPASTAILQAYPVSNYPTPTAAYAALQSDVTFKCPSKQLAGIFSATSDSSPVYFYSFNHAPDYFQLQQAAQILGVADPACLGDCAHSLELPYIFHIYDSLGFSLSNDELQLRTVMRNAWASFVVSATPSFGSSSWPQYSTTAQFVNFDLTLTVDSHYQEAYCGVLAAPTFSPTGIPSTTSGSPSTIPLFMFATICIGLLLL